MQVIPSTNSELLVTCQGGCTPPSYCWEENKQLERAKRPAEKKGWHSPFTRHQRIQWCWCFITSTAHRTTCLTFAFLQCLEATNSGLLCTRQHMNTDAIPSFQLTVQQLKALPMTSWARCCRWGCCLCFQQGLGFHLLWLQTVTIFPLINTTAFWGRPIFQNGVVLLKKH